MGGSVTKALGNVSVVQDTQERTVNWSAKKENLVAIAKKSVNRRVPAVVTGSVCPIPMAALVLQVGKGGNAMKFVALAPMDRNVG